MSGWRSSASAIAATASPTGGDGPIYVPGTLPGEEVEVETGARPARPAASARHRKDERGAHRTDLSAFRRLRRLRRAALAGRHAYRAWKRNLVVEALRQAGIEAPVGDLIDAHGDGRRRVVFHARRGSHDVLEVGFSAARAHRLVAIDRCPVLAKSLDGALTAAWAIAEALDAREQAARHRR